MERLKRALYEGIISQKRFIIECQWAGFSMFQINRVLNDLRLEDDIRD